MPGANGALVAVGVDIGGSHVSVGCVDLRNASILPGSSFRLPVNPHGQASTILPVWSKAIRLSLQAATSGSVQGIGIAMPGPFDYENGISKIAGVSKLEKLFGVNVKNFLATSLDFEFLFQNDASCSVVGEYWSGAASGFRRVMGITLGTGFGSTFLENGDVLSEGRGVPNGGFLYNVPYKKSIADDHFSSRWFLQRWNQLTGGAVSSVKELYDKAYGGDPAAIAVFSEFSDSLAGFLAPWLKGFQAEILIIGGSISHARGIFLDRLTDAIHDHYKSVEVRIGSLGEDAPVIGAAKLVKDLVDTRRHYRGESQILLRDTTQALAPVSLQPTPPGVYDVYPAFPVEDGEIFTGFDALADWICRRDKVVIDGYVGVFWDNIREKLTAQLKARGKSVVWREVQSAMLDEKDLDKLVEPFLNGDDPLFGKRCDKGLSDFFVREKLEKLVPDSGFEINILAGPGAALAHWNGALVYIDLPKNELQYRMRAKSIANLGKSTPEDSTQMYKRFYFVDWVILNRHKKSLLPSLDIIVDGQRPEEITWMTGQSFRSGLKKMGSSAFRVRPWFEPGVWGGTWIKENIPASNKDVVNYAWSFELIAPENGIMFQKDGRVLEASFDFLMYQDNEAVLGEAAIRFGDDFPIRFDFLDTFDGGNLSIQCHPRPEYIKEVFGEPFTQDEAYYILDTKNDAHVYLGFQESIDSTRWKNELAGSQAGSTPVEIDDYVQSHPAHKHDLFLIPNGTVHGSGVNNLVLEISSTPYIFTFKMYDWLRMDLYGKPRPINIEHAFNNLYFDRKGEKVEHELIAEPVLIEEGTDWKLYHLKTHPLQFYDVHRYEFQTELHIRTEHKCFVMSLVEGSSIVVQTENGVLRRFNYAETFIVPASANYFRIKNGGRLPAKLLKVFVKSDACSHS